MSETEWLESNDVGVMLEFAGKFATDRQLRLFACGCCRRIWHLLTDERSRKAVEVAERYANGEVGDDVLQEANNDARQAWIQRSQQEDDHASAAALYCSILKPTLLVASANRAKAAAQDKTFEMKQQATLLRQILGKQFNAF